MKRFKVESSFFILPWLPSMDQRTNWWSGRHTSARTQLKRMIALRTVKGQWFSFILFNHISLTMATGILHVVIHQKCFTSIADCEKTLGISLELLHVMFTQYKALYLVTAVILILEGLMRCIPIVCERWSLPLGYLIGFL